MKNSLNKCMYLKWLIKTLPDRHKHKSWWWLVRVNFSPKISILNFFLINNFKQNWLWQCRVLVSNNYLAPASQPVSGLTVKFSQFSPIIVLSSGIHVAQSLTYGFCHQHLFVCFLFLHVCYPACLLVFVNTCTVV